MSTLYERLKNFCSPRKPIRPDEVVRQSAVTAYDEAQEQKAPVQLTRKDWAKIERMQKTR